MSKKLEEFEGLIGVQFKDKSLLKQAFIHRSYLNENRKAKLEHNERLEFLGDAVLELVTTHFLYEKYPETNEGELTSYRAALVNTQSLASVAEDLNINEYLHLSKGESKDTGKAREHIWANTIESIIGALYLDQGYEVAKKFILENIAQNIEKVLENKSWIDAKSFFQEKAQEHESFTPVYKKIKESGPDHDKHFVIGVYVGKKLVAQGEGKSKQEAEQEAARKALEKNGWE